MSLELFASVLERHCVAVIQRDVQRNYRLMSYKNLILTVFDVTLFHILSRTMEISIVKSPRVVIKHIRLRSLRANILLAPQPHPLDFSLDRLTASAIH